MRCIVPLVSAEDAPEGSPASFTPELWEGETLDFSLANVKFTWNLETAPTNGHLFITSKRVIWVGVSQAYDFDVAYISLHAISKDPACYPQPCVFCQLDEEEQDNYGDEEDDEEEQEEKHTEMFLIPEEEADIYRVFDAFSHAALLNPDPEESEDEDNQGNDDFIFNESEVMYGAAQAAMLASWESKFVEPGDNNGHIDDDSNGDYDDHEEEDAADNNEAMDEEEEDEEDDQENTDAMKDDSADVI